jgi:hypothetical protein
MSAPRRQKVAREERLCACLAFCANVFAASAAYLA